MAVNLTFYNNQNFILIYNMAQWAGLYDLTQATFRMQIRQSPGDALPVYSFSSASQVGTFGTISYDRSTGYLTISASYSDVRTYMPAGNFAHDLTLEIDDPLSGALLINRVVASGSLLISDGVSLL